MSDKRQNDRGGRRPDGRGEMGRPNHRERVSSGNHVTSEQPGHAETIPEERADGAVRVPERRRPAADLGLEDFTARWWPAKGEWRE